MNKLLKGFREENGNAMILAAGGLTVAIMFMALVVDLGMYYSSYRKLKAAVDFVDAEVQQMLPYYAYADDYADVFRTSVYDAVDNMGYSAGNIVDYKINRKNVMLLYWAASVTTEVKLQDEYQCIFLGIIGINEFPIYAQSKITQTMAIEQPYYPGMPYEEW